MSNRDNMVWETKICKDSFNKEILLQSSSYHPWDTFLKNLKDEMNKCILPKDLHTSPAVPSSLTHPSIYAFHFNFLHTNLNSSTVASVSPHLTFGTPYLSTSELMHPSVTKSLQILQISPVHQSHLPLNLYQYSDIFFFHTLKPTSSPFPFPIIPFSAMFHFSFRPYNFNLSQN